MLGIFNFSHHQKMTKGNAGAEITIDKVLQSRIPYANPLSNIKELV